MRLVLPFNREQERLFLLFWVFSILCCSRSQLINSVSPRAGGWQQNIARTRTPPSKQRQKWGWDVLLRVTSALAMLGCPVAYRWPYGWPRRGMVSSSTPLSHLSTLKYTSGYPRQRKSVMQFRDKPSGFSQDCASFCFNLVFWTANVFYLEIQCL